MKIRKKIIPFVMVWWVVTSQSAIGDSYRDEVIICLTLRAKHTAFLGDEVFQMYN